MVCNFWGLSSRKALRKAARMFEPSVISLQKFEHQKAALQGSVASNFKWRRQLSMNPAVRLMFWWSSM